jgi:phosphate transport system substrate-binding protein
MSRQPMESEFEMGIKYVVFAEERVAVVTSPDLSGFTLPVGQVRAIFNGEIDNWSSVGGPDALIRLVIREKDDSNTKIIRAGILGDDPFSETAVLMTSESDTKDALDGATHAIGYLAFSGVISEDLSVHPVALNGLHPADTEGDYPLPSRSLGVAFLPEKFKAVQGFVDFISGSQVEEILANQGLLAITGFADN